MARLKGFAIAALAIGLSGCTALEQNETQAWLALHAVDTAQTLRFADMPECFHEADLVTRSIIGESPSRGEVLAWSIGTAAVHVGVTQWLLQNDHPKLASALQYVHIGLTASAIAQNHSIGVRIGSPNKPSSSCRPASTTEDGHLVEIPN